MITDIDGNELTYWHVTGLVQGQDSDVIVVGKQCPVNSDFYVASNPYVNVLARRHGTTDAFQNLNTSPINLRVLTGLILFDVKLSAPAATSNDYNRVALYPGVASSSPAGWTD